MDKQSLKKRRSLVMGIIILLLLILGINPDFITNKQPFDDNPAIQNQPQDTPQTDVLSEQIDSSELARDALENLVVKGRAPKTGYSRDEYGSGWATIGDCDTRNEVLQRDLENEVLADDGCIVLSGDLKDPYSGSPIAFTRGSTTSANIQIDHVVALSDAWQKGAQEIGETQRLLLANDSLNLLAVDGSLNQQKGDKDAASWLPPNKMYRCQYVARQIAVKLAYKLWVSEAEKSAMRRVLNGCGDQRLPIENYTAS